MRIESKPQHQMLICELSHGNQEAFRFYYAKYWETVYLFIYGKCKSHRVAEDGSQQVFECVWRRRATITTIYDLQRIIALGCTSVVLKALKEGPPKNTGVSQRAESRTGGSQIYYSAKLKENLLNVKLMAVGLNKLDQKSTAQFKAELDFMETILKETKGLAG
ncbi:hypothetical protein KK062_29370 [Fulvivirgaceae bacterium PWU5]|uniref:Uncharacterized protein n=1 Tax=Dawidia cretensis TaxID=2782350 RepID=A0AAP2E3H4_9BACT|nr:hypothetical protein [Dawidia cretensis]MBT1712388.1 hypothetical protein [Dawidia cretensis]